MRDDQIKKFFDIISSTLKVKSTKITLSTSPEDIISWDSMNHMCIVVALENEFNITFNEDELEKMIDVKSIFEIVSNK